MNPTTTPVDLQPVIDTAMCIGCGICTMVDESLELVLDPRRQIFVPSHASGSAAADICPAIAVDYDGLHASVFPGAEVTPFGVVESVHLAQSKDEERNVASSSGGLIKELILDALADPDVDGAIALGHIDGLEFRPQLLTEPDEVAKLPGSIYHNLAHNDTIKLLDASEGKRLVVVGIPCHLEGLFAYIDRHQPELRERIAFTIGLLCGWQYTHHSLRAIAEFKGIEFDEISDVAYRGGGPIGKLRITAGGEVTSIGRRIDFAYQTSFDRSFNIPRCHLCVNHTNYFADIVVGDAWLPSTVNTRSGISIIVVRSEVGRQRFDRLVDNDLIVTTEVSTADLLESQKRPVVFGDTAYAYQEYLDEIGEFRPTLDGPNKGAHQPAPRSEIVKLHSELEIKRDLQDQRKYRRLLVRKATVELRRHVSKYTTWFVNRVLRFRSLTGKRQEVPREEMKRFR